MAWQVRESERQKVIEGLMRKFYDASDEGGAPRFSWEVARLLLWHLLWRSWPLPKPPEAITSYVSEAARTINEFARSLKETEFLLLKLYEKVLADASRDIITELQREEMTDPQLIFHASSAGADVPLPEE